MKKCALILIFGILFYGYANSQVISGYVIDGDSAHVSGVNIYVEGSHTGTITNDSGYYKLKIPQGVVVLVYQHVSYQTEERQVNIGNEAQAEINVTLRSKTAYLDEVAVSGSLERDRLAPSVVKIEPLSVEALPGPFADFSKILATLPGVVSNNELSSTYSVRGGNFDENLVYVNGIPIYRPQLVTAGRQEGLSFVNTSLVENITFSAGGWQARYGDKLSSTLDVRYKQPDEFGASMTLGLLGGQLHLENTTKNKRVNYLIGLRHKRSEYLLNSLETKGEYLPRFTDIQSMATFNIGPQQDIQKTQLSVLMSYARNRYAVTPASRETEFGTFNESFRLFIAFVGRELLQYDTYQGGLKLKHKFNHQWTSEIITSAVSSEEREFKNIEGGYRLCDLDTDINSNTFNECLITRGIGTNFEYSRNILDAQVVYLENKNTYEWGNGDLLEFGIGANLQQMDDQYHEYAFRDSSAHIISLRSVNADNEISNNQYHAYIQNTFSLTQRSSINAGIRGLYTAINNQMIVSPRIQYAYRPNWEKEVLFKASAGWYYQPAFYRELRDYDGRVYPDTQAQQSMHFILGMEHDFKIWKRDFNLYTELYYKQIGRTIPYDVDNVRIRYYPTVGASAYASGFDMKLSGEFIPGSVSWFSLGVLTTKEKVDGLPENIRRPTDQRVNLGVFFQDHLPKDPTWRVNLSLQLGTGLPFGPPESFENRAKFNGDIYRRVDVGFLKEISLSRSNDKPVLFLGVEVLNLLGVSNTISYTWIEDVVGQQFAIPNGLSTRFLNVKLTIKI